MSNRADAGAVAIRAYLVLHRFPWNGSPARRKGRGPSCRCCGCRGRALRGGGADPRQAALGRRADPTADPAVALMGAQLAADPVAAGSIRGTDGAAAAAIGIIRPCVDAAAVAE